MSRTSASSPWQTDDKHFKRVRDSINIPKKKSEQIE